MKILPNAEQPAFDVIEPETPSAPAETPVAVVDPVLQQTVVALQEELGTMRREFTASKSKPAAQGPDAASLALVFERIEQRLAALEQRPTSTPAPTSDHLRAELTAAWKAELDQMEKKQAAALAAQALVVPSKTEPAWPSALERIEKRLAALEGRPVVSETAIKAELERAWKTDIETATKKLTPAPVSEPEARPPAATPKPTPAPAPIPQPVVKAAPTPVEPPAIDAFNEAVEQQKINLPPLFSEELTRPNMFVRFWRYLNQPAFRG